MQSEAHRFVIVLILLLLASGCHRSASVVPDGAAGGGKIEISCRPDDAIVYIDGEIVGIASDFDGSTGYLELSPGSYIMEVKKEGYVPFHREVTVGGERVTIEIELPEE